MASGKGIAAAAATSMALSYGANKLKQKFKPNVVAKTIDSKSTNELLQGKIAKCPPGMHRNAKRQCVRII